MTSLSPTPKLPQQRNLTVTVAVVAAHALALWGLLQAFQRPAVPTIIPATVLAEWIEPAPPAPPTVKPTPQPQPPAPQPKPKQPTVSPRPVVDQPAPEVAAAPVAVPSAVATPVNTAPAAPVAAPPAPPAPPRIELPSSNADYLNNPRPPYPPLSKRLGEQGKVMLRVYIETDGSASKAEIRTSSGYERLDQTALQTVLRWRYVPGKRNGVPEAMWFNVPINFVLE